jgi:BNR repeat-like domain
MRFLNQPSVTALLAGMAFLAGCFLLAPATQAEGDRDFRHLVVFHQPERFAGWPANGGMWVWDDGKETLVSFAVGGYKERKGHNVVPPYTNTLARTKDGGETWEIEKPKGFFQDGMKLSEPAKAIDFGASGFAMRVIGDSYQGSTVQQGGVLISTDRGHVWEGPYPLPRLTEAPQLRGYEITSRTDYLVNGAAECVLFGSVCKPGKSHQDRVFWCRTTNGGRQWDFGGWVVGPDDANRAVMPSTVRLSPTRLVTAIRRRELKKSPCWIDGYGSEDNGRTWKLLGKIGSTGGTNGNPPALVRLRDGRLCCVYGNRDRRQMLARLSTDGTAWGEEIVLRDGYRADSHDDADLGYPRAFQRPDGKLVAVYYWADAAHIEPHIAATIWRVPEATKAVRGRP